MNDHKYDDSVIYDDTRYFQRGRSALHPEPTRTERIDALWAILAIGVIVALFLAVHAAMPQVR